VGALIILLCFTVQITAAQGIDAKRSLDNKFDPGFKNPNGDLTLGQLQLSSGTVYFPWAKENRGDRGSSAAGIMSSGRPEKEEIKMGGSHPQQALEDLTAVNSVKERDVVYDGAQNSDADSQIPGNSMDIRVSGKGRDNSHVDEGDSSFGNGIERVVDDALASSMHGSFAERSSSTPGRKSSMNNMNIDVSGISASAINTAPGGSAVVNNNIIIKPVQVILVPTDSQEQIPA
ncbi:MAG: hypothetical protein NTV25_03805, partial [Methanothrix sp.]|nr:hypothetical protein [Methanothrix sp.]